MSVINKVLIALVLSISALTIVSAKSPIRISMYAEQATVADLLEAVNDVCQTVMQKDALKRPDRVISYDFANMDCNSLLKMVSQYDQGRR